MSSFAVNDRITDAAASLTTRDAIDAAVKANRAVTPAAAVNKRAVPRLSVEELNNLDLDTLRDRLLTHPYHDDRPAFVKVLDTLDLPRNALWNILAPGIARRKKAMGETETFGLGSVHFSDVLDEMGVHNRLVKGIVGFIGDLATDPLIYLNGIGGVTRLTSSAGHVFEMLPRLHRDLKAADKVLAAGKAIDESSAIGQMLKAAGPTVAAQGVKGMASRAILGDIGGLTGKVFGANKGASLVDRLSEVIPRLGSKRTGGLLAEGFNQEGPIGDAARRLVKEYGVQASPGLRIGKGGMQVFHIPLTDWNIQVPAIGAAGLRNLAVAKIASGAAPVDRASPVVSAFDQGVHDLDSARRLIDKADNPEDKAAAMEVARGRHEALNRAFNDLNNLDAAKVPTSKYGTATNPAAPIVNHNDLLAIGNKADDAMAQAVLMDSKGKELNDTLARRAMLDENVASRAEALAKETSGGWTGAYGQHDYEIAKSNLMRELPEEDRSLLSLSPDELHQMGTNAEWAQMRMDAYHKLAQVRRGSIAQFINENKHDRTLVDIAKRALGTDSDIIGSGAMTPIKTLLENFGLKDSFAYEYANKIDDLALKLFGRRPGAVAAQNRALQNQIRQGSRALMQEWGMHLVGTALDIADKHGIDVKDKTDELGNLLFALGQKAKFDATGVNNRFWTTRAGSNGKVPSAFAELLEESQKSGLLQNAEFMKEMQAFAASDEIQQALTSMGELAEEGGLIGHQIPGYMPSVTTPKTSSDIRNAAYNAVTNEGKRAAGGINSPGLTKEAFQKGRDASLQYRFISKRPGFEGQERWFWHSDLPWADASDKAIAELRGNPATSRAADIADDIKEYRSMADRPEPRYVEPMEMNRYQREGKFAPLTMGKVNPEGFFDTNLFTAMASRVGAHERASGRRTWANYMQMPGVSVDGKALQGVLGQNRREITMSDGSVARVVHRKGLFGPVHQGVEWRGDFYRPLSADAGALKDNPIIRGMGLDPDGADHGRLFHSDVAHHIEAVANATSDSNLGELLNFYDSATNLWKAATIFRPGFLIANLIGDSLNAIGGGARIADASRHAKNMLRIVMNEHNPEVLGKITVNVAGQELNGEQVWNLLRDNKIVESHQMADVGLNAVGHRWASLPSAYEPTGVLGQIPGGLMARGVMNPAKTAERVSRDWKVAAARLSAAAGFDSPTLMHKIKAADYIWDDRLLQTFFAPWMRVNQKAANWQRGLAFLSHLEQGNDVASAAQRTIRSMFDYSDMSKVERSFFRRMFPFYSWIRNNGVYQFQNLLHRPIYAGSLPLLKHAVEEVVDGDEKLPEYMRPNWIREQMAMQLGSDPNHRVFLLPRSALPQEQAAQLLEPIVGSGGLQDFMHYFVSNLNPIITKPMEYATGHEFFSGRTINADPLLSEVPGGKFLTESIPPLAEAGKVIKATRDRGVGAGVSRFLIGGRLQPGDDQRIHSSLVRDFKEQEEGLRRTLTRAQSENDAGTRFKANLRLMQLYRRALDQGLEKEVPVWARKRLAELAPAN